MRKRFGIALASDIDHEDNRYTAMKRDKRHVTDLIICQIHSTLKHAPNPLLTLPWVCMPVRKLMIRS